MNTTTTTTTTNTNTNRAATPTLSAAIEAIRQRRGLNEAILLDRAERALAAYNQGIDLGHEATTRA